MEFHQDKRGIDGVSTKVDIERGGHRRAREILVLRISHEFESFKLVDIRSKRLLTYGRAAEIAVE